jgi:chromosomal replication initiator protein
MTAPARILTVSAIQQTVARYYKLPVEKMTEADRHREFAWPRQMAMLLARRMISHPMADPNKRTPINYTDIGRRFNRDKTTIFHGIRRAEHRIATDPETARDFRHLTAVLELGE